MTRALVFPSLSSYERCKGDERRVVFPKDTDDDLVNDAREHYHQYGGANVRQTQSKANEAMRGAGHETGGLMKELNKEQALTRSIELWERPLP